jgi:hypothetical protein
MNIRLTSTIFFHILISACYFLLGAVIVLWNIITPTAWSISKLDEMPFMYRLFFGIAIFAYGLFRTWRAYRNYKIDLEEEEAYLEEN